MYLGGRKRNGKSEIGTLQNAGNVEPGIQTQEIQERNLQWGNVNGRSCAV